MKNLKGVQVYVLALHPSAAEDCAKAQILASVLNNEECRHLLHSKINMVALAELAMTM